VEPRPSEMRRIRTANRSCHKAQVALSGQVGSSKLTIAGGLSGLSEHFGDTEKARIQKTGYQPNQIAVNTSTFMALASEAGLGDSIDFVSIDVEGAEMVVMESINFSTMSIGLLTVENNYRDPAYCRKMRLHDFCCAGQLHFLDEIFINQSMSKSHPECTAKCQSTHLG